jgi:hypothetical protein
VNLNFILKSMASANRTAVVVNGVLMWAVFFLVRIVIAPTIIFGTYLSLSPESLALSSMIPVLFTLAIGLQFINLYWFGKVGSAVVVLRCASDLFSVALVCVLTDDIFDS